MSELVIIVMATVSSGRFVTAWAQKRLYIRLPVHTVHHDSNKKLSYRRRTARARYVSGKLVNYFKAVRCHLKKNL